jgi:hypothetical protein
MGTNAGLLLALAWLQIIRGILLHKIFDFFLVGGEGVGAAVAQRSRARRAGHPQNGARGRARERARLSASGEFNDSYRGVGRGRDRETSLVAFTCFVVLHGLSLSTVMFNDCTLSSAESWNNALQVLFSRPGAGPIQSGAGPK